MHKFFEENKELIRIVAILSAGILFAIVIVVVFVNSIQHSVNTYYDEYSEQEISLVKTGGEYATSDLKMSGFDLLTDYELSTNGIVFDSLEIIRNFMKLTHPDITRISVVKKSIEKNTDTLSFQARLSNNEAFSCKLVDFGNGQFVLTIDDKNGSILDYDTSKFSPEFKNPKILAKKYLPYTIRQDNLTVTLQEKSGTYTILVSSCGDEKIKQSAQKIIESWLKTQGFNSKDFNFEIPNICDKGAEHS